ncbi:MAG: V-type ATP synthase subunit D [Bacteroidales bacterium]|nr:V-type ATP synthase subunit D [Bacteroidales bacterium]
MAIRFQYNKTSLNELNKQLKVRVRALPTLKNKESALRMEVKKAKERATAISEQMVTRMAQFEEMASLWNEFEQGLLSVTDVQLKTVKIAGVPTPALEKVLYEVKEINLFTKPLWYADGLQILKDLVQLSIESEVYNEVSRILDFQRKKTTQKVNLYEKVQIPGYNEAIRKIKRYMEDEENLSKASQKIVKNRHLQEEEVNDGN